MARAVGNSSRRTTFCFAAVCFRCRTLCYALIRIIEIQDKYDETPKKLIMRPVTKQLIEGIFVIFFLAFRHRRRCRSNEIEVIVIIFTTLKYSRYQRFLESLQLMSVKHRKCAAKYSIYGASTSQNKIEQKNSPSNTANL